MNVLNRLLVPLVILTSLSCQANEPPPINEKLVKKLVQHYFSDQAKINAKNKSYFKSGDFNGDMIQDLAVLIHPKIKPKSSAQLQVSMPWVYPGVKGGDVYRTSLVIFHGNKQGWFAEKSRAFVFLDTSGTMETPSFELLVIGKGDQDYKDHSSLLSISTSNDLIIIPTEAGIDTYIYWKKDQYKLFEPEEMP